MADYDVGVTGLTSPPSLAVLQSYRPAVSVRNNGIHDALASGTLRVYSAGRLIFTTELYSAVIPPSETRDALATDYWTPPAEGNYLVIADVTCPLDQVERNNHLAPTTITVTGEPPPPPPVVAYHAAQHEDGGPDEMIVDGLHGRLADSQTALAHKASHQAAGSDELDLTGMGGILRDGQPIADHHETHEDHGGDEMNVEGLQGVLFNLQKPKIHANEAHDPNYSTVTRVESFYDAYEAHVMTDMNPHATATGLEHTISKNLKNGYAGLDEDKLIARSQLATPEDVNLENSAPLFNNRWGQPFPAPHHETHEAGGVDPIDVGAALFDLNSGAELTVLHDDFNTNIAVLLVHKEHLNNRTVVIEEAIGTLTIAPGAGQYIGWNCGHADIVLAELDTPLPSEGGTCLFRALLTIFAIDETWLSGFIQVTLETTTENGSTKTVQLALALTKIVLPTADTTFRLAVQFVLGAAGTRLDRKGFRAQTTT